MNGLHKEQGKNLRNLITVYSQHFLKFSRNSVNGRHKEQGKNLRNSITIYSQHFLKFRELDVLKGDFFTECKLYFNKSNF